MAFLQYRCLPTLEFENTAGSAESGQGRQSWVRSAAPEFQCWPLDTVCLMQDQGFGPSRTASSTLTGIGSLGFLGNFHITCDLRTLSGDARDGSWHLLHAKLVLC